MHSQYFWRKKLPQVLALMLIALFLFVIATHVAGIYPARGRSVLIECTLIGLGICAIGALVLIPDTIKKGPFPTDWFLVPLAVVSGIAMGLFFKGEHTYSIAGKTLYALSVLTFIGTSLALVVEALDHFRRNEYL